MPALLRRASALERPKFRHPFDNLGVRSVLGSDAREYKARRLSYPHMLLRERDPRFRANWDALLKDYGNGKIGERQFEQLFFSEVASALARRRATLP